MGVSTLWVRVDGRCKTAFDYFIPAPRRRAYDKAQFSLGNMHAVGEARRSDAEARAGTRKAQIGICMGRYRLRS